MIMERRSLEDVDVDDWIPPSLWEASKDFCDVTMRPIEELIGPELTDSALSITL